MQVAEKHFGHLGELPSIDSLVRNVSVILINQHQFYLPPRPSMPGIVFIGGSDIEEPKPLPDDLKKFLDEAKDGAILFSFGTFIKSDQHMPPERFETFLNSFGQVKQRVLWQYDDDSISIHDVPSNVLIRKSLPQTDILAHVNVVLFINHGLYLICLNCLKLLIFELFSV